MSETRRLFLLGSAAALLPLRASAAEQLHIGAARGSIDFSIGDSKIFRTTGSFKDWRGFVNFNPDGCKISLWGLDEKINALGNKIHAAETKGGGVIAHAVATTVKTIIVGVNQIF